MAIPFALPTEDEAEAQERRLHGLLLDVYSILQQVIRARGYQTSSQNREFLFTHILYYKAESYYCDRCWFCLSRSLLLP